MPFHSIFLQYGSFINVLLKIPPLPERHYGVCLFCLVIVAVCVCTHPLYNTLVTAIVSRGQQDWNICTLR